MRGFLDPIPDSMWFSVPWWLQVLAAFAALTVGVLVGCIANLRRHAHADGERETQPASSGAPRVVWHPDTRAEERVAGPLVYAIRQRPDAARDQDDAVKVKIGLAGDTRPGAAGRRVRQYATGIPHATEFVFLIPLPSEEAARAAERQLHGAFDRVGKEWFRLPAEDEAEWGPVVEDAASRHGEPAPRVQRTASWFAVPRMRMLGAQCLLFATLGRFLSLWARIPAALLAAALLGLLFSALRNCWPGGSRASIGQGIIFSTFAELFKKNREVDGRMVAVALGSVVGLFVFALAPRWWFEVALGAGMGLECGLLMGWAFHRDGRPRRLVRSRLVTG